MRNWWRRVQPAFIANTLYVFARCIGVTVRATSRGEEILTASTKGKIIAGWHGRSFLVPLKFSNRGWYVLVSHSRDGEIMSRLFTKFGYKVIRGSTGTHKGGIRAAVECAKVLRQGATLLFSPDGAKGPTHIVQDGTMWLAQTGEAEIIPATTSARPRKLFNSWDSYQMPLPFAKALYLVGQPIDVPKQSTPEEVEVIRLQVQEALNAIELEADAELGFK